MIPEPTEIEVSKIARLAQAKEAAQIASIRRKERIAAIEDYSAFIVTKAVGLAGTIIGGLVFLRPGILPLTANQGLYVLLAGIALLAGKKVFALLSKLNS
jgi:hypothetical protein